MQPNPNGAPSPVQPASTTSSLQQPRDIDVDPSSLTATPLTAPGNANAPAAPASQSPEADDLENQPREFLLQRVRALERQLTIRNSDCSRLLSERQQLLPLKDKCESQKEMILALRGQLDLARAQRESAVDAMEAMKRRQRDQEHRDRITHAERAMYGGPPTSTTATTTSTTTSAAPVAAASNLRPTTAATSGPTNPDGGPRPPASSPNIGRRNPGGTVVNTAAGPQLLYDSSDISSVGFTKNAKLPYDFLGGPGAQQQYLARYNGGEDRGDVPDGGLDASEDAQVHRVLNAAKDQVQMEAKYAEMEDKEEEALMARIKALREGRK